MCLPGRVCTKHACDHLRIRRYRLRKRVDIDDVSEEYVAWVKFGLDQLLDSAPHSVIMAAAKAFRGSVVTCVPEQLKATSFSCWQQHTSSSSCRVQTCSDECNSNS